MRSHPCRRLQFAHQVVAQIVEYRKYDFDICGIVGVNRSPTCGVDTTSQNDQEVQGEGVFIEALRTELTSNKIHVKMIGIKALEPEKALKALYSLIESIEI